MSKSMGKTPHHLRLIAEATVLECDGRELRDGLWESGVYLGADGFVYYMVAELVDGRLRTSILGKRGVGEYLRWVDELFKPGEVPGESSGMHFRAARKLRELI